MGTNKDCKNNHEPARHQIYLKYCPKYMSNLPKLYLPWIEQLLSIVASNLDNYLEIELIFLSTIKTMWFLTLKILSHWRIPE